MASRVEIFDVTVPALTPVSAPFVATMTFDIGEVERVEIIVPPGPSGLVGFGILHSGESVLPREPARFVKADAEVISWPLNDAPTAGRWGVRAYNLDIFPHTLYFRWLVHEIALIPSLPALVPIE
jgi:hypothetical protein